MLWVEMLLWVNLYFICNVCLKFLTCLRTFLLFVSNSTLYIDYTLIDLIKVKKVLICAAQAQLVILVWIWISHNVDIVSEALAKAWGVVGFSMRWHFLLMVWIVEVWGVVTVIRIVWIYLLVLDKSLLAWVYCRYLNRHKILWNTERIIIMLLSKNRLIIHINFLLCHNSWLKCIFLSLAFYLVWFHLIIHLICISLYMRTSLLLPKWGLTLRSNELLLCFLLLLRLYMINIAFFLILNNYWRLWIVLEFD